MSDDGSPSVASLQSSSSSAAPFLVVGVGASAGGLDAIERLLGDLRAGAALAVVVLLHSDASARGLLSEVLAKSTELRVVAASDGLSLAADCVYTAPGGMLVTVEQGVLRVTPRAEGERTTTAIDHLLYSLATDQGARAVGVVLSGSGSDGALGLRTIGDAGGMTLVQDPETAKSRGMPQAALETTAVDHVGEPEQLARELMAYARHVASFREGTALKDQVEAVLPQICEQLLASTGHNFQHYKTSTLTRRALRRVQVLRLASAHEYVQRLRVDRDEAEHLFRDLLIGVTAFFRDPEAFKLLQESVVRPLIEQRKVDDPIRIWVAGCATGEEAYSLAMLVREELDRRTPPLPEVQIFATDLDERSLAVARQGTYPLGIAEEVSPERLARFFVKKGQEYHATKELRDLVLFSVHNLINDPPFSKLDLVSCRNVLIYLGTHLQKKLIPLFHYALKPAGYLFLGPSENLSSHRELFRPIEGKFRISQRLPTAIRSIGFMGGSGQPPMSVRPPNVASSAETDTYLVMQRIILDEFAPKAVVVDDEGQVVCASGNLEKYLTVTAGAFHNSVTRLAREGLRVGLRSALAEAAKTRRTVVHDGLSLRTDDGVQRVNITVQPMPQMGEQTGLFLVAFQDVGTPLLDRDSRDSAIGGPRPAPTEETAAFIEHLERELAATRQDLLKTVQDLESTNEELKSSNEELLSMNEELQSANEELETSKEEVQAANDSLGRVNTDLENLLASTRIATLFLDTSGNLRRVTAATNDVYNVQQSDHGRPLSHFTHRAKDMPPLPPYQDVAAAQAAIEHEVEMVDGRWFMRRVLPYRRQDGSNEGIVVTFVDVTERKRAEQALRQADKIKDDFIAILAHELRNPLAPIRSAAAVLRNRGEVSDALRSCGEVIERQVGYMARLLEDLLDVSRIGRGLLTLRPEWIELRDVIEQAVETTRPLVDAGHHTLKVDVPASIRMRGDPTRLAEVVANLLSNAAKYTPTGGTITVTAERSNGFAVISVKDTGVGIEPASLSRVFDMFSQVESTLRRSHGGLGIGLSLTRGLVRMHGGEIEARSEGPGRGSEFIVRLPILEGAEDDANQRAPADSLVMAGKRRRIIVVDDNTDNADMLALMLEFQGHDVKTAYGGEAGFKLAAEMKPDVMLLDVGMPEMNGYELAQKIREQTWGRAIVLIAQTGWGQEEDKRQSQAAGFDWHLTKPIHVTTLLKLVNELTR